MRENHGITKGTMVRLNFYWKRRDSTCRLYCNKSSLYLCAASRSPTRNSHGVVPAVALGLSLFESGVTFWIWPLRTFRLENHKRIATNGIRLHEIKEFIVPDGKSLGHFILVSPESVELPFFSKFVQLQDLTHGSTRD